MPFGESDSRSRLGKKAFVKWDWIGLDGATDFKGSFNACMSDEYLVISVFGPSAMATHIYQHFCVWGALLHINTPSMVPAAAAAAAFLGIR